MSVIILLAIIAVLWIWDEMRSAPTINDEPPPTKQRSCNDCKKDDTRGCS